MEQNVVLMVFVLVNPVLLVKSVKDVKPDIRTIQIVMNVTPTSMESFQIAKVYDYTCILNTKLSTFLS